MNPRLNEALRLLRVFHDMPRTDLVSKLRISNSYLSELENGRKQPSLDIITRYSEVFSVPVSSILFFSESLDQQTRSKRARSNIADKIVKMLKWIEEKNGKGYASSG